MREQVNGQGVHEEEQVTMRSQLRLPVYLAVSAVVTATLALLPGSAAAKEGKPFEVTEFTMQTVASTSLLSFKEEAVHGGVPEGSLTGLDNVPYTFTQAGGHPWGLTTTIGFATEEFQVRGVSERAPTRDVKDIVTDLPPGLLGDPMAVPRCSLTFVVSRQGNEHCPADTQIGVFVYFHDSGKESISPIVNVTPEAGQSAEFALENTVGIDTPLLTGHLVRTRQGYGFTVVSNEIPIVNIEKVELTFWGVPGDPSHDPLRGLFCDNTRPLTRLGCQGGGERFGYSPVVPFLTMGTNCAAGPQGAVLRADAWEEPGRYVERGAEAPLPTVLAPAAQSGLTGCGLLQFDPSVEVEPDTLQSDAPVGLGVTVGVPLSEKPGATATPQLRDTVLTLPEGVSVSPGIVDGIQACEATGPEGINIEGPESEELGLNGEPQLAAGHCPDASTVGTAEAITPLLPEPVKGHVYLAKPGCGGAGQSPCTEQDALDGNLYRLYLELGGTRALARTGVHFKVPMLTEANPATGQLTTRVLDTPQAPFSELKIHLNGGPRAPLNNPAACGPALTTAEFTPWSAPGITPEGLSVAGTPDATPSSFYNVDLTGDGQGTPCAGLPLNPGFVAGTVTPQAGQFSAFTLNFSRGDREQFIKGIQVHTPPGLLGMLSSVTLCEEPQADSGHCPEASKIGTTRVASGAGSHPFEIEGTIYLTGPHDGAPFGLSIVTDAVAGPFDLGLVIVRARIAVDPVDSTLTVTTDESGPYALPQIVFGVPLRLQRITARIDRPGFMFNPTNCGAPGAPGSQQVTARVSGSANTVAGAQSRFAVGGCQSLAFKPSFAVSTSAHASRADGASLDAKLSYPPGSVGSEANIASVKVELPKQLPSRLTTLQKACTVAQFETNPGGCPAASIVGVVRASTPLLAVPLSGPVYFVSHGGEAFPSLVVVLQGEGVRVDLTGSTFISKSGITSSTFKTVPDVPVDTFELYLPEGPYSALAANGNLCPPTTGTVKHRITTRAHGHTIHRTIATPTAKPVGLLMPTEMIAQNGAVLHQQTVIAVTGCAANTKAKPKQKSRSKARHASVTTGHGRTR
jgi:hypothetical protein